MAVKVARKLRMQPYARCSLNDILNDIYLLGYRATEPICLKSCKRSLTFSSLDRSLNQLKNILVLPSNK